MGRCRLSRTERRTPGTAWRSRVPARMVDRPFLECTKRTGPSSRRSTCAGPTFSNVFFKASGRRAFWCSSQAGNATSRCLLYCWWLASRKVMRPRKTYSDHSENWGDAVLTDRSARTVHKPEGGFPMVAEDRAELLEKAFLMRSVGASGAAVNAGQGFALGNQTHRWCFANHDPVSKYFKSLCSGPALGNIKFGSIRAHTSCTEVAAVSRTGTGRRALGF
jgi:hypothetical protein